MKKTLILAVIFGILGEIFISKFLMPIIKSGNENVAALGVAIAFWAIPICLPSLFFSLVILLTKKKKEKKLYLLMAGVSLGIIWGMQDVFHIFRF